MSSAEQATKGEERRCDGVLYTCRVDVHQDLVFVVIKYKVFLKSFSYVTQHTGQIKPHRPEGYQNV